MRIVKVYITCQNQQKTEPVIGELPKDTGKSAIFLPLNLSSFDSVKVAAELLKRFDFSPVLLNLLFNILVAENLNCMFIFVAMSLKLFVWQGLSTSHSSCRLSRLELSHLQTIFPTLLMCPQNLMVLAESISTL
jgi:hypothetical protein